MKRIFTFLFAIVMAMSVWATVPQTISYQAVVRNHVGQLMKESKVGVKVTILHGSESGSVVYEETRVVTTNKNGLLTFAIGDEKGSSRQSLSDIDWSDGIYFLRCDYDLQGGSNYEMTTSTQIKSVPYALYAERVSPNALPQWVQSEEKPTYSYAEIVDAPTVPTKVSELENDAKYITLQEVPAANVPTKLSELENDAKFITKSDVPTKVSQLTNDADYAKKSELPSTAGLLSEVDAAATYQPKGDYLTEHQSLAEYAKKSELPSTDGLLSEVEAAATYQPKGDYLTEHQSLAEYAKKSDLPSTAGLLSEAEAAATYQPKGDYLTEHQSLAEYAKKSDLPSTEGLLSEVDAAATYQPKGEYLTEHQSLADYAKKSELPTVPTKVSAFENDANYLTEHQSLAEYAKKIDLPKADSLLSKTEATTIYQPKGEYLTEHQSLADYAKKSELPSTSGLLSEVEAAATYQPKGEYLTEHQSLADYAKKSELPTVPTKVSAFENDANYLTEHQSLTDYAKKSDLPKADSLLSKTEATTIYQPKGEYLTEHQSLAEYAKKSELPSTEGLLSEVEAAATYQPKGEYLTEHQSLEGYAKTADIPTKVSAFENDANYLTEHQSLADYAKKSELPSVPVKVSQLTNDEGYVKLSDILADIENWNGKSDSLDFNYFINASGNPDFLYKGNRIVSIDTVGPALNLNVMGQNIVSYNTDDKVFKAFNYALPSVSGGTVSVPTKVSQLVNDADYAKKSELPTVPTKVSAFENDATYVKAAELPVVPENVSAFTNDAQYITKAEFDGVVSGFESLLEKYRNQLDSMKKVLQSVENNVNVRSVEIVNGALPGEFSVSADKKVKFSMGNLQYNASTNLWRFADNQYVFIGDNNSRIDVDYSGWIDLFGWGTSGYNNTANDSYAKNFYPYSSSTTEVNATNNSYGYGPSINQANKNIVGKSAEYDWGVHNAITNGGNEKGKWRVLTNAEWTYLYSGRSNAAKLRTKSTVEGVHGYIFFPDNWVQPDGVHVTMDAAQYSTNNFSASRWNELESLGAVFFPAGGYRNGTTMNNAGESGSYWSSTYFSQGTSYCFYFTSSLVGTNYVNEGKNFVRSHGRSVRLVQVISDEVSTTYTIDLNATPAEGGEVTGAGTYEKGASVSISATPATGYTFKSWSDGNTEANRTITISEDIALTATFEAESQDVAVNGALPGKFSVSATKQVSFAKGNLQYQASTDTWRFAGNQYDVIGEDNKNISASYSGWIDLFGWGTSGWESGANAYLPYSSSSTYDDYYPGGSSATNLTGEYANADWGVYNAISNGGNQKGQWRTLTKEEWAYLYSGRVNAATLRTRATVESVPGYILFPDNWVQPDGISITLDAPVFASNEFSLLQWNVLETEGAVFLPCAGRRDGTLVDYVGTYGYYWSSTYYNDNTAWHFFFSDNNVGPVGPTSNDSRHGGRSVRLVQDLSTEVSTTYTIDLNATPAEGGQVTGAGTYIEGESVSIKATPATGYTFKSWSDGSTQASRTIIVREDITLTATFEAEPKDVADNGALPGKFSVSATKQVQFSKGNLQYQASTKTWRFAENQYDVIGKDNENISSTYSGWIDLFGWGTSGYHDASDTYNKNYMPYSSSTSEVSRNYNYYGFGPSTNRPSPNLTNSSAKYDWGVYNAISNGGNKSGVWRTLTKSEWEYLYETRSNAKELRGQAIVNGINGYVLLPDDWVQPSSVSFNASPSDFRYNNYTISQWQVMESAGAVFLPCAGRRKGITVSDIVSNGDYWSSTFLNVSSAYSFYFLSSRVVLSGIDNRSTGRSVRLVQE